jgi:hypothetical protein
MVFNGVLGCWWKVEKWLHWVKWFPLYTLLMFLQYITSEIVLAACNLQLAAKMDSKLSNTSSPVRINHNQNSGKSHCKRCNFQRQNHPKITPAICCRHCLLWRERSSSEIHVSYRNWWHIRETNGETTPAKPLWQSEKRFHETIQHTHTIFKIMWSFSVMWHEAANQRVTWSGTRSLQQSFIWSLTLGLWPRLIQCLGARDYGKAASRVGRGG